MLLIRRFEGKAGQAYSLSKIKGYFHRYDGQEAVAVGTISVLNDDDAVITAYRDHGHAIARGMDPNACMAELFGKITGCSRGKGGSMHFFDAKKQFLWRTRHRRRSDSPRRRAGVRAEISRQRARDLGLHGRRRDQSGRRA